MVLFLSSQSYMPGLACPHPLIMDGLKVRRVLGRRHKRHILVHVKPRGVTSLHQPELHISHTVSTAKQVVQPLSFHCTKEIAH